MDYVYVNGELYHHGILGQKWGVRRYQNEDGSLTEAGKKRYGRSIQKLERKMTRKYYKETGVGSPLFRTSTGKEYDKVIKTYENHLMNDKKYKELSKAAFDAEKARLLAERDFIADYYKKHKINKDDPVHAYDVDSEWWNSDESYRLSDASEKAALAKEKYADTIGKRYIEPLKDAKIKDLNITENIDLAKKFLRNNYRYDLSYYDGNLQYNPDHYYEPWVEREKFK